MEVGWVCLSQIKFLSERPFSELSLSRGQLGLLAGAIGLLVLLIVASRRRRGLDGTPPHAYAREQAARIREENRIKIDMEELLGRLTEAARELDVRMHKLERVMREADARIDRLERLVRASDGQPQCDVTVADESSPRSDGTASSKRPNPEHAPIYQMADAGRSALEIAQAVGRNRGEIELILALRPKCPA